MTVRAVDSGSPPLNSRVIVQAVIVDENNDSPVILYPLQNSTSPSNYLISKGAEASYLVTKVVALDRDSSQNLWLFYEVLKATELGLFSMGAQNRELKTMRTINNGHPPQSTSATLSILPVEGFSDPYMKLVDISKDEVAEEEDYTLTMYLVICLASISFVFLVPVVVFAVIKIQKRRTFLVAQP